MAEAVTGDSIPADQVCKEAKQVRERLAYLFFESIDPVAGPRLAEIWREYEENQTEAAKLVHDADKLQRLDRAFGYARRYPKLDLSDFKSDATQIENCSMRQAARHVLERWTTWEQRQQTFVFVIGKPAPARRPDEHAADPEQAARAWERARSVGRVPLPLELSTCLGKLLRREQARSGSRFRGFITQSFEMSIPVPPMLIIDLLQETISHEPCGTVILDGFPLT